MCVCVYIFQLTNILCILYLVFVFTAKVKKWAVPQCIGTHHHVTFHLKKNRYNWFMNLFSTDKK